MTTPNLPSTQPLAQPKKHIIILGAGVTGLSTTLALLKSNPNTYCLTIIATHFPTDRAPEYTSPWAGGHWRSHVGLSDSEAQVRKWDGRTYQHWKSLLSSPPLTPSSPSEGKEGEATAEETTKEREKRLGLGFRESRNYWGVEGPETEGGDGRGLWWSHDTVDEFRILRCEERKGAIMGIRYRSICFDPPRYLNYLLSQIYSFSGVQIIQTNIPTIGGIHGVVTSVKLILPLENQEVFCLLNCTGLGARHFVGEDEAQKLFPVRGQTMLVKGDVETARTYTNPPGGQDGDILYVVPRPGSGMTILGGCKQVGSWEEGIDEELNGKIRERVRGLGLLAEGDGLLDEKGEFEIVAKQVGFRPARKGGPRLEVEKGGKVDGVWVVHSYGHGGGGFQASWGCAEEVVGIIEGLEN